MLKYLADNLDIWSEC